MLIKMCHYEHLLAETFVHMITRSAFHFVDLWINLSVVSCCSAFLFTIHLLRLVMQVDIEHVTAFFYWMWMWFCNYGINGSVHAFMWRYHPWLTRLVVLPLRLQSFPISEIQMEPPAIHVSQYLKNGYHFGVHPLPAALTSVYKRST